MIQNIVICKAENAGKGEDVCLAHGSLVSMRTIASNLWDDV